MWAKIKWLVNLFATFSQIYQYIYIPLYKPGRAQIAGACGGKREARRIGGRLREMQNYTCITILRAEVMALARDCVVCSLADSYRPNI
jgi:hypothetical protein